MCGALAICLANLGAPVRAWDGSATVRGTVVQAVDSSPIAGARVHLGDPATDRLYRSAPADENGDFEVEGLPAAVYQVAVEADGGLYVVPSPLAIEAAATRTLNLAVGAAPSTEGSSPDDDSDDDSAAGWRLKDHPLVATLATLGAAVIIGAALEDDNSPSKNVSRSQP
jgi:hypothetical protein